MFADKYYYQPSSRGQAEISKSYFRKNDRSELRNIQNSLFILEQDTSNVMKGLNMPLNLPFMHAANERSGLVLSQTNGESTMQYDPEVS